MIHYYAVLTKCGHVGKDKCIKIWFAVKAENSKVAALKARKYKRVKHNHKDAIIQVREITFEEYKCFRFENDNDPYLQCKNIQQQRTIKNFEDRVEPDEYLLSKYRKTISDKNIDYLLKKNAIKKKDAIRQIQLNYQYEMVV